MTKLKNKFLLWLAQLAIEATTWHDVEDKTDKSRAIKRVERLKKWNAK